MHFATPNRIFILSLLQTLFEVAHAGIFDDDLAEEKGLKDYCQSEYFNATCAKKYDVIVMDSARYGRMRQGRCCSGVHGNLGCSRDVLSYFDRMCSGRARCRVYIADPVLHRLNPCQKELASYLEAKYHCVTVSSTANSASCKSLGFVPLYSGSGYLSSEIALETGPGTADCPWQIQVSPGQKIRLTLVAFAGGKARTTDDADADSVNLFSEFCYEIGTVSSGSGHSKTLTACGGSERKIHNVLYMSESHNITVQLQKEILKELSPFVIHYEGQGCQSFKAPAGGWVSFDRDVAVIGCNATDDHTWTLICDGIHWTGHLGNCTQAASVWGSSPAAIQSDDSFPYGILVVVAIGVALGVFVGGSLLTIIAVCMRKRNDHLDGSPELEGLSVQTMSDVYARSELERWHEADRRYRTSPRTRSIPDGGPGPTYPVLFEYPGLTACGGTFDCDDADIEFCRSLKLAAPMPTVTSSQKPPSFMGGVSHHLYESPHCT